LNILQILKRLNIGLAVQTAADLGAQLYNL